MANAVYYIEVNLICIIILLLLYNQLHRKSHLFSTAGIIFELCLFTTVAMCVSDIAAGCFIGMLFPGARAVLEISNILFFISIVTVSYLWLVYVLVQLRIVSNLKNRTLFLLAVPLLLFSVYAALNPVSHRLFTLDAHNVYARGVGVYFHWIVTWLYLIVTTVLTAFAIAREKNKIRRQELIPLLYFIIAPIIASVVQMLFYGVTSIQVGVTVSIVIAFLSIQGNQVLTDALTGLNNRRALNNYFFDYITRHSDASLTLIMLDLNDFKHVNDRYGHMVGDRALTDTASALKAACADAPRRMFLCRYGGDEFLIAGSSLSSSEQKAFLQSIRRALAQINEASTNPYTLELSIGIACDTCADMDAVEQLLRTADDAMYAEKMRYKERSV